MSSWNKTITAAGQALIADAVGKTFRFSKAQCGTGAVSESVLENQTALVNPKSNLSITSVMSGDNVTKVRLQLKNAGITESFQLNQIGLFANLNNGTDVLFMIIQTREPDTIPSAAESPNYVNDYVINTVIGNAETVTGNVDTAAFVTAGQIAEFEVLLDGKVDKEAGKGLSSNDFTTAEKNKLSGIAANANNYTHPTGDGNSHVPATGTGNSGKVLMAGPTANSASWQPINTENPTLQELGVGYGTCATSASATAKTSTITGFALVTGAIVGIRFTNANTSTSPTLNVSGTGAKSIYYNNAAITTGMITATMTALFQYNGNQWVLLNPAHIGHTHDNATASTAGFMSSTDKSKLDGIAANANNYTHPSSGVTAGTYRSVTVNAQGHVTAGSTPTLHQLGIAYGTCSTTASTVAKTVTASGFALQTGSMIAVRFTNANTAASPTLNVNSTGAKNIYFEGAAIITGMITAGMVALFSYNGTQWELLNPSAYPHTRITSGNPHNVKYSELIGLPAGFPPETHTHGLNDINEFWYGTCSTATSTAAKTSSISGFTLTTGAMVFIKFTYTTSATSPTLNISTTGAKPMFYNGAYVTSEMIPAGWAAQFQYNGTQWVLMNPASEMALSNGVVHGTCSTVAGTTAKVGTLSGFALRSNSIVGIRFTNANTAASPTLNVNGTGAKPIYYNGAYITSGMIMAGMLAWFRYNGTQWELLNPPDSYAREYKLTPVSTFSEDFTDCPGYLAGDNTIRIKNGVAYLDVSLRIVTSPNYTRAMFGVIPEEFRPKERGVFPGIVQGHTTTLTQCQMAFFQYDPDIENFRGYGFGYEPNSVSKMALNFSARWLV